MSLRVAVIGAGLGGLTAADALRRRGLAPVVFEKSRGIGGRLATRRTRDGLDFDHGAPAVAAEGRAFAAFLDAARAAGEAADWAGETVGLPGMSALPRRLAEGLDLRFGVEAASVTRDGSGWRIAFTEGAPDSFDRVIVTAPAPQTARLCATVPEIAEAAAAAGMTPCWTIMAAWSAAPAGLRLPGAGPLAEAICMSGKPGRATTPVRWVGHAAPAWTRANLEREAAAVAPELLAALAATIGADPAAASAAVAHRWRFARVARPVGRPVLASGGLVAAGDWLLGPDAEHAHASGLAAAEAAAG